MKRQRIISVSLLSNTTIQVVIIAVLEFLLHDGEQFHPAWQVVLISRSGHILDIKVLPAIRPLPSVDVVDHGPEGLGVQIDPRTSEEDLH